LPKRRRAPRLSDCESPSSRRRRASSLRERHV
jgi:hypothetical protein